MRLLLGFLEGDGSRKFSGTVVNWLSEKLGVRPTARPRDVPGVDDLADWPAAVRSSASELTLALRENDGGVPGDSIPVPGVHILIIESGSSSSSASSCRRLSATSDGWSILRICRYAACTSPKNLHSLVYIRSQTSANDSGMEREMTL